MIKTHDEVPATAMNSILPEIMGGISCAKIIRFPSAKCVLATGMIRCTRKSHILCPKTGFKHKYYTFGCLKEDLKSEIITFCAQKQVPNAKIIQTGL